MASLPNIQVFNDNRKDLIKIKNLSDEVILFNKSEAIEALTKYITEELDLISSGITKETKDKILERVNFRLKQIEITMLKHINDKIDKITEKIVENSLNRIIEKEVNKRLEEKLEKIKQSL